MNSIAASDSPPLVLHVATLDAQVSAAWARAGIPMTTINSMA
jgi:hypothetical protein